VSSRAHAGRLLVRFVGVDDRTSAEDVRGAELSVEADLADADDGDSYADVALIGLDVRGTDGTHVGSVVAVDHLPMQDLLVVKLAEGRDVRVPFVAAMVPEVDLPGGWLSISPPPGLMDENLQA
jgi:16S rRNA processing protein RimM